MNILRVFAFSAALFAAATPASAFTSLGSVHLTGQSTVVRFQDAFPGRLEWLGFQALHGDVTCDRVTANFADGSQHVVWRGGRVSHGGGTAELPRDSAAIRSMEFHCKGSPAAVEIQILGDLGRYEDEWRRHPEWNSKWSARIELSG